MEALPAVQEWFDYYNNGEMQWDGRHEINLEAFPGVTFHWTPEQVSAVLEDGKILPLYTGIAHLECVLYRPNGRRPAGVMFYADHRFRHRR